MTFKREDTVYAEGFRYSQEGHAVWPKVLSTELKPGACGYFNGDGDWITIVQLTDIESVKKLLQPSQPELTGANPEEAKHELDLAALEGLKVTDIGGSTDWSEKTSSTVRRQAVDVSGAVIPPGAALGPKAGIQYTCTSSRGAVLVARPPVSCSRLTTETDLITWVENNIEALAHKGHWPSIKKRGLWVIRKTYHAPECAKHVFQGKDESVSMHVGARVPNLGDATASASWWNQRSTDSGWTIHRAKEEAPKEASEAGSKTEKPSIFSKLKDLGGLSQSEKKEASAVKEENIGVVMFFGGIWWRKGRLLSRSWKTEEEFTRQSALGGDAAETPSVFVEDPTSAAADSEEAFLELKAGLVGEGLPSDDLPKYDDSYEIYADDGDDE